MDVNKIIDELLKKVGTKKTFYLIIFLLSPILMLFLNYYLYKFTDMVISSNRYLVTNIMWIAIFSLTGIFGIIGFFKNK